MERRKEKTIINAATEVARGIEKIGNIGNIADDIRDSIQRL